VQIDLAPSGGKFVVSTFGTFAAQDDMERFALLEVFLLGIKPGQRCYAERKSAMKFFRTVAGMRFCSLLPAAAMLALLADPAHAADESVREKAALCTPCHGDAGVSQTENIPSLAGQPDLFLQWQLIFFRSGARKSEIMQPMAEQLSNEDVRNLGAYFASLPPPATTKPDEASQMETGAKIAAGRGCASCHTDTFVGTKGTARIAGQREEYLVKALHDYKSGVRSGGGMAAMSTVAYSLSDDEISALAHYLAHL
jgi:cytochrome c553